MEPSTGGREADVVKTPPLSSKDELVPIAPTDLHPDMATKRSKEQEPASEYGSDCCCCEF